MGGNGNFVRTASGVWKLEEAQPARPAPPVSSQPSGLRRTTPARGLPQEPAERARVLAAQARAELAKGNHAAAETSYRLALTFAPNDAQLGQELKAVAAARDRARREAQAPKKP